MIEHVRDDTGCYFLFRMQNPKEWLLITYVPDGLLVFIKKFLSIYNFFKKRLKIKWLWLLLKEH